MDSGYQFGRIQVSCEGYDYPDDPYVLRGSCGVSVFVYVCVCVHAHIALKYCSFTMLLPVERAILLESRKHCWFVDFVYLSHNQIHVYVDSNYRNSINPF